MPHHRPVRGDNTTRVAESPGEELQPDNSKYHEQQQPQNENIHHSRDHVKQSSDDSPHPYNRFRRKNSGSILNTHERKKNGQSLFAGKKGTFGGLKRAKSAENPDGAEHGVVADTRDDIDPSEKDVKIERGKYREINAHAMRTIAKSKIFHPSLKYVRPHESIFSTASTVKKTAKNISNLSPSSVSTTPSF